FGFQAVINGGLVQDANPYTFIYMESEDSEDQTTQDIERINQLLEEENIKAEQLTTELHYYTAQNDETMLIGSESMYNKFAKLLNKQTIDLENNEIIGVRQGDAMMGEYNDDQFFDQPVELENGEKLHLKKVIDNGVLPELFAHYVVSDETYEQLPEPSFTEGYTAWKAEQGQKDEVLQAGETLSEELKPYNFQAIDYTVYSVNKSYGPILFIGLFIGIVFFVSAGSFLYFRLFMDLEEDKTKFTSIAKMGLTDKELKTVITRQTMILFFAPIIVALVHGAVALTALSHFFNYNLVKESSIVLGSFFAIQIIYFI